MTSIADAVEAPRAGDVAPDFSLQSTSGATVALTELRGREAVLLAFFPLAFTRVCTVELCAFRDDFEAFTGHGVRVLPVSVDSVPTLVAYRQQHDLGVELLSDFHRHASRAYGVLIPERNYSNRAYFLIDRDGIVRWSHVERTPSDRRENAELLAAIAGLD